MTIYGYVLQLEDGRMLSPIMQARKRYGLNRTRPKIYAEKWHAELAVKKNRNKYPGLKVKAVKLEIFDGEGSLPIGGGHGKETN